MGYVVERFQCNEPARQRNYRVVGTYATLISATTIAEQIIDASLRGLHEPGATALHLFARWNTGGESARIVDTSVAEFDAYACAKSKCEQMCLSARRITRYL